MNQNEQTTVCDNCGRHGAKIRYLSKSYGKGATLFVIENVPVVSCHHCSESYLTAETLHEIERLKHHRQALAIPRPVPVAVFA
jgi:YgiT-type zinc finger domain-containing protein